MDYLQRVINKYTYSRRRGKNKSFMPLVDIIKYPNVSPITLENGSYYYKQKDRILQIVQETKKNISALYSNYSQQTKEEKITTHNQAANLKQECVEYIDKLSSNEATMYLLLREISKDEYNGLNKFMFEILFGTPNKTFFTMIKDSKEDLCELVEWKFGNIQLYDYLYYKQKVS